MSRYIDADRLIDDIRPFAEYDSNRSNKDWVRRFEIAIETQQTANVVEVVRCKDCKHSSPNKVYGCRFEPFNNLENGERMYSDDFCSYGERKEA